MGRLGADLGSPATRAATPRSDADLICSNASQLAAQTT